MDWWAIGGYAIGIIGVILTAYTYYVGRRKIELRYETDHNERIFGFSVPKPYSDRIALTFDGEPIRSLAVSSVIIWNAGTATIEKNRIAKGDPIFLQCAEGDRIVDCRMLAVDDVANRWSYSSVSEGVAVTFDFVEPGQGVVLEVLHMGSSRYPHLSVSGTLIGGGRIRHYWSLWNQEDLFFAAPGVLFLASATVFFFLFWASRVVDFVLPDWVLTLTQAPAAALIFGVLFLGIRRIFRQRKTRSRMAFEEASRERFRSALEPFDPPPSTSTEAKP